VWVKVDDKFPRHPKVLVAAGELGRYGHARVVNVALQGMCYAAEHLTDGFIPREAVKSFIDPHPFEVADVLVKVTLWHEAEGGYQVHDWAAYNPSAEETKERRTQRAGSGRLGGIRSGQVRRSKGGSKREANSQANNEASASPLLQGNEASASRVLEANANPVPSRPVPEERTETHTPRARGATAGLMVGSLQREHLTHAWCGTYRRCVPGFLHGEFVRALGGDPAVANERLRAFYEQTMQAIPEEDAVTEEPVKFWRVRVAAAFPTAASARLPAPLGGRTGAPEPGKYAGVARGGDRAG